jgi:hypothetical protein
MPETQLISDHSQYLTTGCDSYTLPQALSPSEYIVAMNVVNRGGIVQTRPGTLTRLMVGGTNFQGMTGFTPSSGIPHLVYALDGYIYVSAAPFRTWRKLPNLRFNPASKFVAFESCLKSTDYTAEGALFAMLKPYQILIMQDGVTRAGFWDGGQSRHLNPTSSKSQITKVGFDETFIGLWMRWSGNRLWVSRGAMIFASDSGNPLKFTEAQYINDGRAFYLPSECTGMVETPDHKGLICFTDSKGILIQTNIQDRTKWLQTPEFVSTAFQNTGCVSPLSIATQYGLIWWFSATGLVNSDQALAANRSSRIDIQDNEMSASKGNMGPDLSKICSCAHENYLLLSVPSGSRWNRHTWCLDQAVFEGGANAWSSFWTGWRPVQWVTLKVDGEERVFFGSHDYDGCNRIWEAFRPDRTDNGSPITCFVQLRDHDFSNSGASARDLKRFHFAQVFASEILGDTGLMVAVAGSKGGWTKICTKDIVATPGGIFHDMLYDVNTCMYGHKPQTRTIYTQADVPVDACQQAGVESPIPNSLDRAFSLLLVWSGQLGVAGVQLFASIEPERIAGKCEDNEVGERSLSQLGCAAMGRIALGCPFEKFVSTQSASFTCPRTGTIFTAVADAESVISQVVADRMALALAKLRAEQECVCEP